MEIYNKLREEQKRICGQEFIVGKQAYLPEKEVKSIIEKIYKKYKGKETRNWIVKKLHREFKQHVPSISESAVKKWFYEYLEDKGEPIRRYTK